MYASEKWKEGGRGRGNVWVERGRGEGGEEVREER